jgi:hypothetical protein
MRTPRETPRCAHLGSDHPGPSATPEESRSSPGEKDARDPPREILLARSATPRPAAGEDVLPPETLATSTRLRKSPEPRPRLSPSCRYPDKQVSYQSHATVRATRDGHQYCFRIRTSTRQPFGPQATTPSRAGKSVGSVSEPRVRSGTQRKRGAQKRPYFLRSVLLGTAALGVDSA